MTDWTAIRGRYLREAVPTRLGGLAANLGRIKSFASKSSNPEVGAGVMEESKRLIEWTAADTDINTIAELFVLQVELARWQLRWPLAGNSAHDRIRLSRAAGAWAQRLLEMSGPERTVPAGMSTNERRSITTRMGPSRGSALASPRGHISVSERVRWRSWRHA